MYQINRLLMSLEKESHRNVSHNRSPIKLPPIEETQLNLTENKRHITQLINWETTKKLKEL